MRRWAFFGFAAWAGGLTGSVALADGLDPSRPIEVLVGPSRGRAPSERLDARRSGRTRTRLPDKPVEVWRRQVGPLDVAPLVDRDGAVLVLLTTPEVVKLSPAGREIWRERIGASPAVVPGVLTSDGTVVIVTGAGHAIGLTPTGRVAFDVSLALRVTSRDPAPLALDDGRVVVAAGRALVALGPDGTVRGRSGAIEPIVGGLLALSDSVLFTTDNGRVFAWQAPAQPRSIGSFGGSVGQGAMLVDARTLVAVVDQRRIVSVDVVTGARRVWENLSPAVDSFDGPLTAGVGAEIMAATASGNLMVVDAAAGPKHEVLLEKRSLLSARDGTNVFGGPAELTESPPLIVDPDGRVAFVRAHGRTGVVRADRTVSIGAERVCGAPIAVLPSADGAMLVACHDGAVVWLGE
jgi:outer membrane protein assembly factor BamB